MHTGASYFTTRDTHYFPLRNLFELRYEGRRVRAFLFLGPQFEADRTKQALVPGAAYTRALLGQMDRRLQDRFCAWVAAAHKQFDEELWFDEPITVGATGVGMSLSQQPSLSQQAALPVAPRHDRSIIEYRVLYVGGTK